MIGKMPEHLEEESKRLGQLFIDSDDDTDLSDFLEANASDELKRYAQEEKRHVEEMRDQCIFV